MRARAALIAIAALTACVPAAQAAPGLQVGIEDEAVMLSRPGEAPAAIAEWQRIGVDVVRLHARWSKLAPAQPGGEYDWSELDNAMDLLQAAGLDVMLTVTGPGPLWTSRKPKLGDPTWDPDPQLFAAFARDVAARYGDRVGRYLIWNEPNIPGWLMPQFDCRRGRCKPAAPHIYRGLVRAAVPAIRGADPSAEIVMGELAPVGLGVPSRSSSRLAPLPFLREMGCVNRRYIPKRSGRCRGFARLEADSIGYHPHGVKNAPDQRNRNRDEAQMADLQRLFKVIDRLTYAKRFKPLRSKRFDLHLTEFAYQTSPPDHSTGVSLAKQALYLQQAAYIAWRHPRVRSLVHYQWIDEPVHYRGPGSRAYSGWQSGLVLIDGELKPAGKLFPHPFVIDSKRNAKKGRFWGQIRPGAEHVVTLQRREKGTLDWQVDAAIPTDRWGYFTRVLPVRRNHEYRFTYSIDDPSPYSMPERFSGVIDPSRKKPRRLRAPYGP